MQVGRGSCVAGDSGLAPWSRSLRHSRLGVTRFEVSMRRGGGGQSGGGPCVGAWAPLDASARPRLVTGDFHSYRGTSLIRNSPPVGPYSRPTPSALWWS